MSGIGGVSNYINSVVNNDNSVVDVKNAKTSKDEEVSAKKVGHEPVATLRNPIYNGDEYEPDMRSAEARNVIVDEYQTSYLNGHYGAGRTRASVAHDDTYFKTSGKADNPAIKKSDIGGYEVNTNSGNGPSPRAGNVKVQTRGGQELTDYISGTSIKEGELFMGSGMLSGFDLSSSVEVSNEMVGANVRFANLMLDGRINYADDNGMGDSYMASARYLFAPSNLFSGAAGVTVGSAPDMDGGKGIVGFGGHANSHFLDATVPVKGDRGEVKFSVDAQSKLSVPIMFGGDDKSSVLNNMSMSSLLTAGVQYDINDELSFGAKYNSNIDFAHMLNSGELPITRFAEVSAAYGRSNFDVGANVYIPLTVYDDSFSDKLTWNVQGGYNIGLGDDAKIGLSASVSGHFDTGVSKVGGDVHFGAISAGVSVDGIDSGDLSLGLNARVDLTSAILGKLFF